jgi:hypothetical protein
MLVGYVSDERFSAIPDALLEFENDERSVEARSRASGAVHAELPPGEYRVTLAKPGFGGKRTRIRIGKGEPHQFRLLSDCLLGYPWPKWVKAGDQSEFRVHSPEAYELELWRYGWQKELIRKLGWYDEHGPRATVQITPDGDYSRTGAEWNRFGYANPALKQYVTAPVRSGLYYFHARTRSGLFFSFPWVVAPAKPACKLAVLASNITWNAYNAFGGRSNYINADRLPDVPTVNARQELQRYTDPEYVNYAASEYAPLSFERPELVNFVPEEQQVTSPIEGRTACHLAPAEWRLLGWLEREAFEYDYYAETQFHFGQFPLEEYEALILSTHPEYWSRAMYERLKRWVCEQGGRLLYLGGNGLNCEVAFLDEATMVVHNGNERERLREGKTDSRFHARVESEASLLGVAFTYDGIMTSAPYRVIDSAHWAFSGTGLREGDLFGEPSLHRRCPGGASGHETDKITPHSPQNVHLLAQGTNPDSGGAQMVIYEAPGGGRVFSVGSITWPSSILVDDSVSKITANVLRQFLKRK